MDFKGISDPVIATTNYGKKPGIFTKIRAPLTTILKNKPALTGIVTVFMLFGVGIGVYLSQKPTQLEPKANEPVTNTLKVKQKTATDSGELNVEIGDSVYIKP